MSECQLWCHELRNIFPNLDKYTILANYGKTGKNTLGFIKLKIKNNTNSKTSITQKNLIKEFEITINKNLTKIQNKGLRKQIIQYILIHELLHIEKKDLHTITKNYKKRKKKKIHTKNFNQEVLERFNQIRKLNNASKIKNIKDLELVINNTLRKINTNTQNNTSKKYNNYTFLNKS